MQQKSPKQDSWSSLLSELGVEDPAQKVMTPEPTSEQESIPEPETANPMVAAATQAVASEPVPSSKAGRFGMGIMPEIPSFPGTAKPGAPGKPKKPEKMSFFDRLASISLFGTGASEKIDTKVITPTVPETSPLAEEILEPKKLQKVEETPRKPKDENRPQIGAVDPWSKIATQLGVRAKVVETEATTPPEPLEPRVTAPPLSESEDEIPDIESMTSFRDLPSKKKKVESVVTPVPEPKKTFEDTDSSPRDRSTENRRPREERKPDKYASDKRGRQHEKPGRKKYDDFPREELEATPIYDEPMELDNLDLVAPSRKERVPSFSLDGIDDEEVSDLPKKKFRNRRTRSRKYEETHHRPDQAYADSPEEFEGDFEEEYEVLTPPPEREYGPSRDVFADLFPEGGPPNETVPQPGFESGPRTRGSKYRNTVFQEASPTEAETIEDSDPFAHFSKRTDRGSRADQPQRGSRRPDKRTEDVAVAEAERSRKGSISDEETSYSQPDSSSRQRGAKGRGRVRLENEEPIDEQNQSEEQEMVQLHRNIPGWEDAILPIIESNIARHASRSGGNRKGSRKEYK